MDVCPVYDLYTSNQFQGGDETFVFFFSSDKKIRKTYDKEKVLEMEKGTNKFDFFKASLVNEYFCLFDYKNITIGSGGDGPAIRLNDQMYDGSTNYCETFCSPILIQNGKKHIDDSF